MPSVRNVIMEQVHSVRCIIKKGFLQLLNQTCLARVSRVFESSRFKNSYSHVLCIPYPTQYPS